MDLEELKRIRQENFASHKKKKKDYYLKNKIKNESAKKTVSKQIYDYEEELSDDNFELKIKEIIKKQKVHVDTRKDKIIAKLRAYAEVKQEYYRLNKEKRLVYDKEYRDKKKEKLQQYRKKYYSLNKEEILKKQQEKRNSNKEKL